MFHAIVIFLLLFAGLYYAETHALIHPGGIVPDLTHLHLPHLPSAGGY